MRKTFLVVLFVVIGISSFAQNASSNPFSYYGLGEISSNNHAIFSGIGNTQITMIDSTTLNFYNPASYSSLGKGQPLFTTGISSRLSFYNQGDTREFNPATGIQSFAMGFSFSKHFGIGFGLKPYSGREYEFTTRDFVVSDSIYYRYSGDGGINEAFLGFSVDALWFLDSTQLAFGANGGWLFGNVTNERRAWTSASQLNPSGGVGIKRIDVRSFHYDLGMYFNHTFNENHKIGLYATIDPSQQLNANFSEGVFTTTNINNPNLYDTTLYYELSNDRVITAPEFTYGLSYTYSFTDSKEIQRTLHPVIALHASFSTTDWSVYSNPYEPTQAYLKTSKISTGVQFTPEGNLEMNTSKTNIFEKTRYRVGFYSYTLPYSINGIQVKDFGTTFGFGVPVTLGNSLSSINLGLAIGKRGTTDESQLNEQYYGINFGISIAPGSSERWFQKRKVN